MPISDIVAVNIIVQAPSVTRTGFGTPCVLGYFSTSHFAERARVYSSLDGLADDGFGTQHLVYKAAAAIFSQKPKVGQVVVGRRALPVDRKVVLTPVGTPLPLTAYSVQVNDQTATYTTDATPTVAEITSGLAGQINALMPAAWADTTAYVAGDRRKNLGNIYTCVVAGTSGSTGPSGTRDDFVDGTVTWAYVGPTVTATDTGPGTSITIDQDTPGAPYVLKVTSRARLSQEDTTVDPGVATDLSAVRTALDGNDDWYALVCDSHSAAEIAALAAAVEPLIKQYATSSADDDVPTSATDDIASVLSAAVYARTFGLWHTDTASFPEAAWLGVGLPLSPGSETWANKTLSGITATKLSVAELTDLEAKGCNYYVEIGDASITRNGVSFGGEYVDVVRFIDALQARIQEDLFALIISLPKVPFTDGGISQIDAVLSGSLAWGVSQGGLAADPPTTTSVPRAGDVSVVDRDNRHLSGITFTGRLAGAIHDLDITGTVTV